MLLAATVELYDGLVAHGLPGQGRLADVADSARYDAVHHHVDVLVVGAGPAGLAAALTAARAGARVALVDEQSEAGGSLLSGTDRLDGAPALDWVAAAVAELADHPEVLHLQRTTAFGSYDDGFVLALERRTDHLGTAAPKHLSRQRVWRFRARSIVVATGAHERPVVFADNDRPGIMLAGAARTFLNRYGVLPGREAVVFTTNDSAYDAALDLHRAGVRVQAVVDARTAVPARLRRGVRASGDPGSPGKRRDRHPRRRAGHARARRPVPRRGGRVEQQGIACDLLLVSGGWNPAVHLFSQARGRLRYDEGLGAFVPGEELDGLAVAGAAAGVSRPGRVPGRRAAGGPRGVDRPGRRAGAGRPAAGRPGRRSASRTAGAVAGAGRVRCRRGHPVRRPAARRDGRRHRPRRRRRPALGRAHQALHDDRHRARPGQDLRRHRLRDHRRAARDPGAGHRDDHVPAPVHAGGLRRPGRPRPRAAVRPGAGHRPARLARRRRGRLRGRRPVEAPALLPAAR